MSFLELLNKILPYYSLILLGFIAGRYIDIDRKTVANLLFYIVIPAVFFDFGMKLKIEINLFIIPVIIFMMSVTLNRLYLYISNRIWPSQTSKASIIAFSAGTANTGYFGLPIAIMLFDEQTVAIYMLMNIGMTFYDYTLGIYTVARGKLSRYEAINSVFKMPILYAFFLGYIFKVMGCNIPQNFEPIINYFTGSFVILGMMIIGMGIANIEKIKIDWKFISVIVSARFVAAPAIMLLLIFLDRNIFHLFENYIYSAALLLSVMPLAANTVIFASIYHAHPEESGSAVLASTLLALVYLPTIIILMF